MRHQKMQSDSFIFIKKLWSFVGYRRKLQFSLLLVLIIFSSLFEMISIGAVFPFLMVLSSPELIFEYDFLRTIFLYFGYTEANETLFICTVFFIAATLFSGFFRISLLYFTNYISYLTCADLGVIAVNKTLYQPYEELTTRNSSEIINSIVVKINAVLQSVVIPVISLLSASITGIGILIVVSVVSYKISFIIFTLLGFTYLSFILLTKNRIKKNSENIAFKSTKVIKILQEGLGSIREIILGNTQSLYSSVYRGAELEYRVAQASNAFIGASPRYLIEPIGIAIIASIAYGYSVVNDGGVESIVPILGTLALSFQRLLPILQQAYAGFISIKGYQDSFSDVIYLLEQKINEGQGLSEQSNNLKFKDSIELKDLSFQYISKSSIILSDINLKITKGSCVGIVGKTGSGKSTLVDIIMGLLFPKSGQLIVDNKVINFQNLNAWRSFISHVPQTIFLTDNSIAENIALNVSKEKIDIVRLKEVLIKAQLYDLVESWPNKYDTMIGERGIMLSGGQRQRIGIARALYKESQVIIFDEATSALDGDTERAIIDEINNLKSKPTVIIIAHRHSTLENCDQIIEIKDRKIKLHGSFKNFKN
jgi:ATP-binding cassette, subfamily B, bacterial PglK